MLLENHRTMLLLQVPNSTWCYNPWLICHYGRVAIQFSHISWFFKINSLLSSWSYSRSFFSQNYILRFLQDYFTLKNKEKCPHLPTLHLATYKTWYSEQLAMTVTLPRFITFKWNVIKLFSVMFNFVLNYFRILHTQKKKTCGRQGSPLLTKSILLSKDYVQICSLIPLVGVRVPLTWDAFPPKLFKVYRRAGHLNLKPSGYTRKDYFVLLALRCNSTVSLEMKEISCVFSLVN